MTADIDILGNANGVAAFVLALAGILALLVKVWRAQKAAVIRAHEAGKIMEKVAAEFQNNHGSSMKDAIDRLEAGQLDQARELQAVRDLQTSLVARVDATYALFAHVITTNTHDDPEES